MVRVAPKVYAQTSKDATIPASADLEDWITQFGGSLHGHSKGFALRSLHGNIHPERQRQVAFCINLIVDDRPERIPRGYGPRKEA